MIYVEEQKLLYPDTYNFDSCPRCGYTMQRHFMVKYCEACGAMLEAWDWTTKPPLL